MSGDSVDIPRFTPFRTLERRLKRLQIYWRPRKGKGGHGSFVGPDKAGRTQAFSLPSSQHRQVAKAYVVGLMRRFGLTVTDLFSDA